MMCLGRDWAVDSRRLDVQADLPRRRKAAALPQVKKSWLLIYAKPLDR